MTTPWHSGRLAMFDTETTGVDPHRDHIVTCGIVTRTPPMLEPLVSAWVLNPGIPIPKGAAEIHGYTDDRVIHAQPASEGIPAIGRRLLDVVRDGHLVVGHNVAFDLTILWAELRRHRRPDLADQISEEVLAVDTMVLDKWADPWRPKAPTERRPDPEKCGSRKLIDTCRIWGIPLSEADAHGAISDALAAGRLAWMIAHRNPHIASMPTRALHEWIASEYATQARSFADYLRKQGQPADHVPTDWPLHTPPAGWSPDQLPAQPQALDVCRVVAGQPQPVEGLLEVFPGDVRLGRSLRDDDVTRDQINTEVMPRTQVVRRG